MTLKTISPMSEDSIFMSSAVPAAWPEMMESPYWKLNWYGGVFPEKLQSDEFLP